MALGEALAGVGVPLAPALNVSWSAPMRVVERLRTWPRESTPWRITRQSAFALKELREMLRGPSISKKDWR